MWAVPGYAHSPFSPKFFMGYYSDGTVIVLAKFDVRSLTRSRDNSDWSFFVGCEPLILGKGRPQGFRDGTIPNSAGAFLQAPHSNFSSIFTRFRDIAAFVLWSTKAAISLKRHFFLPHLQSPQNFPMFPWEQVDGLCVTKSEGVGLRVCAISFQDFQRM